MTSFITRIIMLIIGYAYPAFECFKIVEKNKPEIEQLIFWCQYWIIIAALTVLERVLDTFVSWVPMYGEAKLAFIFYLWYPKTKGTSYIYETFVRPYVAKHEVDIDRNLHELKTRAGDMVLLYGQRSSSFIQAKLFDALQYVAIQSSRARPDQNTQQIRPVVQASGSKNAGSIAPYAPAAPGSKSAGSIAPNAPAVPGSKNAGSIAPNAPAVQVAGSHQAGPVVSSATSSHVAGQTVTSNQPQPSLTKRYAASVAGSQTTHNAASDSQRMPIQPAPADSVASSSPSISENVEEMEVDLQEAQKEQNSPSEPNAENFLRMTRSRLRQTRKLE